MYVQACACLLTFLAACSGQTGEEDQHPLTDEVVADDTSRPVIISSFTDTVYPAFFEAAFTRGTKVRQDEEEDTFKIADLGSLRVRSGRVIACDPIEAEHRKPFAALFPTGEFPVQLAVLMNWKEGDVACSRVVFSDQPVHHWAFALVPGEADQDLTSKRVPCFAVDAGLAVFMDKDATKEFSIEDDAAWKKLMDELGRKKGMIRNLGTCNMALFSSGAGDGCYTSYIGYDKEGRICRLLTDFRMVDWWNIPRHN
jgi:hypothetical protein